MTINQNIIEEQSKKLLAHINKLKHKFNINYPINICVASKYANDKQIEALYNQGFRLFGENKIQDGIQKIKSLAHLKDIQWHFIGHLQRNKVKKAIEYFSVIQSVDSLNLLDKINTVSKEYQKNTTCYIQINIGDDPNKFGFKKNEFLDKQNQLFSFSNITIKGIMIIVPLLNNKDATKKMFLEAYTLYKSIKSLPYASELSMGMSKDYELAIQAGSTMTRIGRMLFQKEGA
ncbi:MAG: YggS family pyridoxal phosphate-dependent enzyme [Actinobacteria bacterium]|nr:YggS family pyridoxal phosphate-dependent enzyme [Actinomycetota bacterium]|tara:strand:- start:3804 stop:4499 length:696 start_codon:yes stop_codon:yes gene_type:complete